MTPNVIDIYHGDTVSSFQAVKDAGIWGVIHKASQGQTIDSEYSVRRHLALSVGLLWGAYDFNTGDPVAGQVDKFLKVATPDASTFCCLDLEDNTKSQMSLAQAIKWLMLVDKAIGRRAWIYSGNRIKELITHATSEQRDFLALHPFWLCEYGPKAKMVDANGHPLPWSKPDLWQYSETGRVKGISGNVDLNYFDGTFDELKAIWPGKPLPDISTKPAEVASSAASPKPTLSGTLMSAIGRAFAALTAHGSTNPEADLINHVTPGKPNSAALAPDAKA